MSESTPAKTFNPAFLEQMKKRNQNSWRCPRCFAYNDNALPKCRSCEMDKPSPCTDSSSVKRSPEILPESDDKKPKTTGFVFKPSGEQQSKSIFDSAPVKASVAATTSFPTTFKFGVGKNAVTMTVPAPVKKEPVVETKEDADSDCMKYESDEDEHGTVPEQDYSEDEKCEDVMEGRVSIASSDCITARTPISKDSKTYDVYVFGSGDCGQLGLDMDITQAGKPVKHIKATDLKTTRIVSGGLFNVIVTNDNKLYSWGCNDECQLGREGEELHPLPVNVGELPDDDPIDQIAAGACHVVILTQLGKVYCWGTYRDSKGILGWSKSVQKQLNPTQIHFPRGVVITSISCGENHSLALAKDGIVYGWGCDEQGQLMFHMPEVMKRRALVPHALSFREGRRRMRARAIWAGGMHSMVLLENGHLITFGLNNWGQLGNGHRSEEVESPERITFFDDKEVVQAALSQHATAVLTKDGCVYTCGRNSYGQLGRMDEDEQCDIQFAKVSFPEDVRIQQIACGNHHILAVDEKGLLYTWGFGDMEQLGNGKYEDETHPYHKCTHFKNKRVVMIDGGAQHSVLLAEVF